MPTPEISTPAVEIPRNLEDAILALKKERRAVILAHYYQESEIQDLADFIGDSLELSRKATRVEEPVILFCGVHFMAETAKILNPEKRVIVPDLEAGCSLADGCPAPLFAEWLKKYPGHTVVSYINCSAAVKALSDVIVTSSSAEVILRQIPGPVVFAPDRNLAAWVERRLSRKFAVWPGTCVVHETFSEKKLVELMTRHPEAEVIAHPECEDRILALANYIGSTTALLRYVTESSSSSFIVATEEGILHQMRKAAPGKELIPAPPDEACSCNTCPHMKRNTMEKVYLALLNLAPAVEVPEAIRLRAKKPIDRMLEMTAGQTLAPALGRS
ncbi:MAG: quinolinate synthase NadA [Acidobacteria bacterium]|nr:quinolinate synthase NadA [Acidobacteriota bacterium]MCK6682909.1 quinolinate synthase NadA [Thermoanaerobaculia bacterium]